MEKSKKFRIGIFVAVVLCALGVGLYFLWGALAERKTGPGTDMEAIKKYLSRYSNDSEKHAKDKDLAVIYHHPDFKKMEPWYAFAEKVRNGEPAWITMVDYTIEGDSIFYYLHYDGAEFLFVKDTTRDRYGDPVYWDDKFTKFYEFREEKDNGVIVYNVILSNLEIISLEHASEVYWEVYEEWENGEFDAETIEYQRFPLTVVTASEP